MRSTEDAERLFADRRLARALWPVYLALRAEARRQDTDEFTISLHDLSLGCGYRQVSMRPKLVELWESGLIELPRMNLDDADVVIT